jgi:RND superfamily putative drug exporter
MAVIFLSFATGRVSFIKMFGVGLTLAVVMDAFLIRGTLVPAFMRLAGDWNWWAPGPLRRFHDRWGISETVDLGDDDVDDVRRRDEVAPDLVVVASSSNGRTPTSVHTPSPGGAFDDPARDPGGVTGSHSPLSRRP